MGVARDLAREMMTTARTGADPREEQRKAEAAAKAEAQANAFTFSKLADLFIEKRATPKQKPATLYETRRLLARVNETWADKPVKDISKADVLLLLDDVAARRRRKRNGSKAGPAAEAKAVQVCLGTLFKWAHQEDHIEVNPMASVAKDRFGPFPARERTLSDDELRAFWRAMDSLGYPFGDIGKLLLLSGQRQNEVAAMPFSELDLTKKLWSLPGGRTKNKLPHDVHLSPQMMSIIQQLVNRPRIKGSDLVFTVTGSTAVSGFSNAKERADTLMRDTLGDLKPWTWHDLRRSLVTRMNDNLNILPYIVEAVVNHVSGPAKAGIAGVYNKARYAEQRRAALEAWGRYIEALVSPTPDNVVVPLRRV